MENTAQDITILLNKTNRDSEAEEQLYRLLEDRFRKIAWAMMRNQRGNHTLQPTALVSDDEAVEKLECE